MSTEVTPEAAHTPLPWRVEKHAGTQNGPFVAVWSGKERIAVVDEGYEPDARLIVRAANNHTALLAALKRTLSYLTSYPGHGADDAYEQARAAITAAEAP